MASKSSSCPAAPQPAWQAGSWQALVRSSGVAARSVARIQQGLDAGTYDEYYIRFVIVNTRQRVTAGRVTKEGGPCTKPLRTISCGRPTASPCCGPLADPNQGKQTAPESEPKAPHPVQ